MRCCCCPLVLCLRGSCGRTPAGSLCVCPRGTAEGGPAFASEFHIYHFRLTFYFGVRLSDFNALRAGAGDATLWEVLKAPLGKEPEACLRKTPQSEVRGRTAPHVGDWQLLQEARRFVDSHREVLQTNRTQMPKSTYFKRPINDEGMYLTALSVCVLDPVNEALKAIGCTLEYSLRTGRFTCSCVCSLLLTHKQASAHGLNTLVARA